MELHISPDVDVKVYKRSIYNVFDWLGDIGGLLDALTAFGGIIISLFTFVRGDQLEAFLLSTVYKKDAKRSRESVQTDSTAIARTLNRKPFTMSQKIFHCLRTKKEKRIIEKGVERINKELEIDYLIRM